MLEYETITQGQRNPTWVKSYGWMLRVYLVPYFGKMSLAEITAGTIQEYRIHRRQVGIDRRGKPPSRTSKVTFGPHTAFATPTSASV